MPDVPGSPRPVLRLAYGNHIIDNIENWIEYANARVGTLNDYSEEKFKDALKKTGDFIHDAITVYVALTKKTGHTMKTGNKKNHIDIAPENLDLLKKILKQYGSGNI